MKKLSKKIKKFICEHKCEIALGVVAGVCTYLFLGNKKPEVSLIAVDRNVSSLPKISIPETSNVNEIIADFTPRQYSCGEFEVSQHLRNLPNGQTHSAVNEALAKLEGIEYLSPNQSFIHSYTKNNNNLVM